MNSVSRATVVATLAALMVSLVLGAVQGTPLADGTKVIEDRSEVDGMETIPERTDMADDDGTDNEELGVLSSLLILVVMLVGVMLALRLFGWAKENLRGNRIRQRARGGDREWGDEPGYEWTGDEVSGSNEGYGQKNAVPLASQPGEVRKGVLEYDGDIQWF